MAKIALSAEFQGFSGKFRPLKDIFWTLENGHSIRHQSIPPQSAGRILSPMVVMISVWNLVSNGNSSLGEPGQVKNGSQCKFQNFHNLAKENLVSLLRTLCESGRCIDALKKRRRVLKKRGRLQQKRGRVFKKRGRVLKKVCLVRETGGGPLLQKGGGGFLRRGRWF